jgi:hypothetical protein
LYALTLLFLALPVSCSGSLFGNCRPPFCRWVEESSTDYNAEDIYGVNIQKKADNLRQLFMFGRFRSKDPYTSVVHDPWLRQENTEIEHPLRTDKWEFNIRWTKGKESHELQLVNGTQQLLRMDLHRSGYVRVWSKLKPPVTSSRTPIAIGRWFKRPWGVSVVVRPLEKSNSMSPAGYNSSSSLSISQNLGWVLFASSFHKNPFGKQPKLMHGTILQQRPKQWLFEEVTDPSEPALTWQLFWTHRQQWFRPVVGKFSAYGVDAEE